MIFTQIKKPLIMGILNVTPDSFSDGGKFDETATRGETCFRYDVRRC